MRSLYVYGSRKKTEVQTVKINEILPQTVDRCIRILSEKFRKWPYNFFTESDAHSYLYYSFFRYGSRHLKITYPSKNRRQTVLVHREYPTFFRYRQKDLSKRYRLDESEGTCGHYDMIVLNPQFIKDHNIETVIFKDNKLRQIEYGDHHLLAAIEFKLLHKPLTRNLLDEIKKDFIKLDWSLKTRQARAAYMLIFNRYGKEQGLWGILQDMCGKYQNIKLVYQESYYQGAKHVSHIMPYWNQNPIL